MPIPYSEKFEPLYLTMEQDMGDPTTIIRIVDGNSRYVATLLTIFDSMIMTNPLSKDVAQRLGLKIDTQGFPIIYAHSPTGLKLVEIKEDDTTQKLDRAA